MGSFEISPAGVNSKYPEDTVPFLFIVKGKEISYFMQYTYFLLGHAQLIALHALIAVFVL